MNITYKMPHVSITKLYNYIYVYTVKIPKNQIKSKIPGEQR